jgi:hypothetical protein
MKCTISSLKIILAFGIFYCLFYSNSPVLAGDDKPQDTKLQIEKLTLFKNGLGFVVSHAVLPDGAQRIKIGQLPIPSFGTFWVGYPKDVKLQNLVTSMEEIEETTPVQSLIQLLQMNTGRKAIIHTGDRDIEGTILSVKSETVKQPAQNPYFMSPRSSQNPYGYNQQENSSSDLVLIKTDKGVVALSPSSILRAEFSDGDPVSVRKTKQTSPSITMNLEKPAGGAKVSVSYLTRGVTWMPSYLIDLSDSKTAKFSAHAIIINEVTDFKNVKVQLVTGFPNIKFGEILSPIARSQSLAEFLNALSGSSTGRSGGQGMIMQQAVMSNSIAAESDDISIAPAYSTAAEGAVAEDLFFYPVKNLTLLKDETAWIPLFTVDMQYKHIYTWKIEDFLTKEERYQPETQDHKNAEEVWHSCRLVNSLDMPLTTAAAEFMTDGEFTGQDVCYYTAPKGETTIRINKALNIAADQAEIEVDRKRNASIFHGTQYDLVTVRGELKIRNKLNKDIDVEITKELSGDVLESQPKCKDVKTAKGLKQINPKHLLTWEIELKSGGEQKMMYQYQVYIRNY